MRLCVASVIACAFLILGIQPAHAKTFTYTGIGVEVIDGFQAANPTMTFVVKSKLTAPASIALTTAFPGSTTDIEIFKFSNGKVSYKVNSYSIGKGTYTVKQSGKKTTVSYKIPTSNGSLSGSFVLTAKTVKSTEIAKSAGFTSVSTTKITCSAALVP